MVRFIHISDCHLGPDPVFETLGHTPYSALRDLVRVINRLPFQFDFVLHTGDVVDAPSEANYEVACSLLTQLSAPVYYVPGNHDSPSEMQRVLLASSPSSGRYDQSVVIRGVQFLLLDSRGKTAPGGELSVEQLAWLRAMCTSDGPPLVVALHHPPITLGVPWIDSDPVMSLCNRDACIEAMWPARDRLRGVFFGHVHRAFQVMRDGIFFSSAPSICGQLKTWPGLMEAELAPEEPPGFCVVTIDRQTLVQQHSLPRSTQMVRESD